jgi:hypothetical protein
MLQLSLYLTRPVLNRFDNCCKKLLLATENLNKRKEKIKKV